MVGRLVWTEGSVALLTHFCPLALLGADTAICPLPGERDVLGPVARGVTQIIWRWLEYGNGAV